MNERLLTVYKEQKDRLLRVVVRVGEMGLRHPTAISVGRTTFRLIVVRIALSFSLSWSRGLDSEQVLGHSLTIQQTNRLLGRGGRGG